MPPRERRKCLRHLHLPLPGLPKPLSCRSPLLGSQLIPRSLVRGWRALWWVRRARAPRWLRTESPGKGREACWLLFGSERVSLLLFLLCIYMLLISIPTTPWRSDRSIPPHTYSTLLVHLLTVVQRGSFRRSRSFHVDSMHPRRLDVRMARSLKP